MMHSFNKSFQKVLLIVSSLCVLFILIGGFMLLRQFDLRGTNAPVPSTPVEYEEPPRDENEQYFIDTLELPEDLVYDLPRGSTAIQLSLFEELFRAHDQFNLTGADEDLITYAAVIAQNFVADFFTLSNKTARTDVGGMQFIAEDIFEEFYDYALNTFYFHLAHHINNFGSASLPTVETIRVVTAETGFYALSLQAYPWTEYVPIIIVDLEWTYLNTTLPYINEFINSSRVHLQEINGEIRIIGIVEMPEQTENQING